MQFINSTNKFKDKIINNTNKTTRSHQWQLVSQLSSLFPDHEVIVDGYGQLRSDSGKLQLDAFIPSLSLAFEFQDSYHYVTTWYSQETIQNVKTIDASKANEARRERLTLIHVPCWWPGDSHSLAACIHFYRPDLISTPYLSLIPLNPSPGYFTEGSVPSVGELMFASFATDVNFERSISPNSWWMGEKYDGVRCCWSPNDHKVYTRTGNEIDINFLPISLFPSIFVDGEFWFGRNNYSFSFFLCKGDPNSVQWHLLRMMAFDVPQINSNNDPFEDRYTTLLQCISNTHPFVILVPRVQCKGNMHLQKMKENILEGGGEGAILRRAGSLYEKGRSQSLIKIKAAAGDKEALVVGVDSEHIVLKMPNGQHFSATHNPSVEVHIGDVVTVTLDSLSRRDSLSPSPSPSSSSSSSSSSSLPSSVSDLSPSLMVRVVRVRHDLEWEDVVIRTARDDVAAISQNYARQKWTDKEMRDHIISFMHSNSRDPFDPLSWSPFPLQLFVQSQSGRMIVQNVDGNVARLQRLFPEIGLNDAKNVEVQRIVMENFAREHRFDPLVITHWYCLSKDSLTSPEVSRVILQHGGNLPRTIQDLFPEINIDPIQFSTWPWRHSVNRRMLFEDFAADNGFNHLVPENWYNCHFDKFQKIKDIGNMLVYHRNNVTQALIDLFPEIGLDKNLFSRNSENNVIEARRIFEQYSFDNNFDPLIASNWYSQPRNKLLAFKGVPQILAQYKGSIPRALQEIFPEAGIVKKSFLPQLSFEPILNSYKRRNSYHTG